MRAQLYNLVSVSGAENKSTAFYDYFMMVVIVISIIPLAFKDTNAIFNIIDRVSAIIYIADYVIRLATADKQLKKGIKSFIIYPFTPMAIIDLLSILPSITLLPVGFKLFRLFRLLRTFRVFRVFRILRYSRAITRIKNTVVSQRQSLISVGVLAIGYILVAALVIFNVEPQTFDNFFDAVYWATVSLTTVGYGDIYPTSFVGRVITMISTFVGTAIVALPAGIITAGYITELEKEQKGNKND
ncbi:MAG: ion transporter [Oscillospiraceae bacterium]|nr:ion transporter [Oscillospiraceae bacterium]